MGFTLNEAASRNRQRLVHQIWLRCSISNDLPVLTVDALLTLSSKGQLVIPARLRQLLGVNPGDRLELSLQADGLLLHSAPLTGAILVELRSLQAGRLTPTSTPQPRFFTSPHTKGSARRQ